jgi:hypothetical protein
MCASTACFPASAPIPRLPFPDPRTYSLCDAPRSSALPSSWWNYSVSWPATLKRYGHERRDHGSAAHQLTHRGEDDPESDVEHDLTGNYPLRSGCPRIRGPCAASAQRRRGEAAMSSPRSTKAELAAEVERLRQSVTSLVNGHSERDVQRADSGAADLRSSIQRLKRGFRFSWNAFMPSAASG